MEFMDWRRFSSDAKRKAIQEALQLCAGKYEKGGIESQ